MRPWLATARTIIATATVTSAAWLIGGALYVEHERQRWEAGDQGRGIASLVSARPQGLVDRSGRLSIRRAAGGLVVPVAGIEKSELVDTFKQAREGGARVHDALDILAPRGTPVVAAAPGRVEKLFVSEQGGNTVYVRSPDGALVYYYAHLDSYAPGLVEGRQVRAGEPLGTVGISGNADPTAPHLHFAVKQTSPEAPWHREAPAINPYALLAGR